MKHALAVALVAFSAPAFSQEIKVVTPAPLRGFLQDASVLYQQKHPQIRITLETATPAEVAAKIDSADGFDLVGASELVVNQIKDVSVRTAAPVIAISQMVAAYPKGAPKPDVTSPERLKAAMTSAKHISMSDPAKGGASGQFIASMSKELGVYEAVNDKMILTPPGHGADPVSRGEADLGFAQGPEILALQNTEATPLLPDDQRARTKYFAVVPARAQHKQEAQDFLKFLQTEGASLKAKQGLG